MNDRDIMRISPSAIRAFSECEYAYARTYVDPLPKEQHLPVPALALGSAVHAAIAKFLNRGGWARCGLDELMAMLTLTWRPEHFGDDATERDAFERARALLVGFHAEPYPAAGVVVRELGVERSLAWRKPRHGILAVGRIDRICLCTEGELRLVDYKVGRVPRQPERLQHDVQVLTYRSIAADAFAWLAPRRITVALRYLADGAAVELDLDPVSFHDGWADVLAVVDAIRLARARHRAGAPIIDAFPPNRGPNCRGCRFAAHCEIFDGVPAGRVAAEKPSCPLSASTPYKHPMIDGQIPMAETSHFRNTTGTGRPCVLSDTAPRPAAPGASWGASERG